MQCSWAWNKFNHMAATGMSASTGKPMPSPQRSRRFVSNFTSSLIFGAPYRIGRSRQARTSRRDDLSRLDNLLEPMGASVNALFPAYGHGHGPRMLNCRG
jgi:hypothetical protein